MTASGILPRLGRAAAAALLLALLGGPAAGDPPAAGDTPPAPVPVPVPVEPKPSVADPASSYVIGTFALAPNAVVDGDTIRVVGKPSVRVLGVDAEETFKDERKRQAAGVDFAAYVKEMRGDSKLPVKFGTPAGEAATAFARQLMKGVANVRLERDAEGARDLDMFGRILGYVIVLRPQGEVNLSEALIRQGHSPYFVKYGRSKRFDERFKQAEAQARANKRGIWGDDGPGHYPDYPERLKWWHARADQLGAWEQIASLPNHITLGTPAATDQLRTLVGQSVTALGTFERLIESETSERKIIILSHKRNRGLPLVVFEKAVFAQLDLHAITSRYVTATGRITLYRGRPQIVIKDPNQVSTK